VPAHAAVVEQLRKPPEAATSLGRQIIVFNASTESELEAAFARIGQQRIGALLGASDPFLFNRRDQVVSLAARHGIPAIDYLRDFAHAGGLMANRNSLADMRRVRGPHSQRGGTNEQLNRIGHFDARRFGRFQVDHKLKFGRLHYWQSANKTHSKEQCP
jgi:hypothetical protein